MRCPESDLSARVTPSRDSFPFLSALPTDFVFLQLGPGRVAVGEGPFEEVDRPPEDGNAFYWNDFELSASRPWKIPRSFRLVADLKAWGELPVPVVAWKAPLQGHFSEAFEVISRAFENGAKLEKLVPVITETGVRQSGDLRALAGRVLDHGDGHSRAYGRWNARGGLIGVTPERFLRLSPEGGETMALAGTSRPRDEARFRCDPKQIREHALVVEGIRAVMEGSVEAGPREVLELDGLLHFHTRLCWAQGALGPEDVNAMIRRLHPTPAVGYLPRSEKVSALHRRLRERLTPPPSFAAPFGLWQAGAFESVVAIRQIAWTGDAVSLPSGCGLIRESDLALEWDELALKRQAVKHFLRL